MTDVDTTDNENEDTPSTTPDASPGQDKEETLFTQDDVNRLMRKTRKAERAAALKELAASQEFESVEEMVALAAEAKSRQADEQTEAQKAQKALEAANAKLAAREQELDAERQARLLDKRNAALRDAAGEADTPEDVILWATAHAAELVDAILTDNGTIDEKAVTAVIEAAKKARPKWFQHTGTPGSPSVAGGRVPSPGKDRVEKILADMPRRKL